MVGQSGFVVLLAAGCGGGALAGKHFIPESWQQQGTSPSTASATFAFGPPVVLFGKDQVQWYRDDVCIVEDYQLDTAGNITVSGAVVGKHDAVSGHLTWGDEEYVPR